MSDEDRQRIMIHNNAMRSGKLERISDNPANVDALEAAKAQLCAMEPSRVTAIGFPTFGGGLAIVSAPFMWIKLKLELRRQGYSFIEAENLIRHYS